MKVGIITIYDSANIGSFIQALSVQEIIKLHGDEPYFIKIRNKSTSFFIHMGWYQLKTIHSVSSAVRIIKSVIKTLPQIHERYIRYKKYKRDWGVFNHLVSVKKSKYLNLDVLLIGSDEIWNTTHPSLRNKLLYGEGVKARRKYGFAVSTGDMSANGWNAYPRFLNSIRNLDAIFARDEQTIKTLRNYQINVEGLLPDPTLQIDIRKYLSSDNDSVLCEEKYLAVYAYEMSDQAIKYIRKFAQENSLKIVAISLPHSWCDIYLNCSPLKASAAFKYAEYVYTSTFHGTILSMLYHKQFLVQPAKAKTNDLLNQFDMTDFLFNDDMSYESFCKKLQQVRDYIAFEKSLIRYEHYSDSVYRRYINNQLDAGQETI